MSSRVHAVRKAALVLLAGALVIGLAPTADARARYGSRAVDDQPPTVLISAPSASSLLQGVVTVQGSAVDNKKLKKVELGVNGTNFRKVKSVKRSSNWYLPLDSSDYADGTYDLTVRAWDKKGNLGTASVPVTIANAPEPPPSPEPEPTSSDPEPEPSEPTGPHSMTTPEGTLIEVDTAGGWTAEQIYQILKENGLDERIGPTLTVKVQDTISSQATSLAQKTDGVYTTFRSTIYLKGVDSNFAAHPNQMTAHEFGHTWTLYHLYLNQQGDWTSYLDARGLSGDSRLDSSYSWSRAEIIAEDYRLLFGSEQAIAEAPRHLNYQIADPRDVPGLREFFLNTWAVPK